MSSFRKKTVSSPISASSVVTGTRSVAGTPRRESLSLSSRPDWLPLRRSVEKPTLSESALQTKREREPNLCSTVLAASQLDGRASNEMERSLEYLSCQVATSMCAFDVPPSITSGLSSLQRCGQRQFSIFSRTVRLYTELTSNVMLQSESSSSGCRYPWPVHALWFFHPQALHVPRHLGSSTDSGRHARQLFRTRDRHQPVEKLSAGGASECAA
mmetsp:Transcript_41678/g.103714  ORF Transcript_41678/g.103714 Transcript_41678/m.103714 type:complete len:214 (-) Transcript_41678:74-715(-)